MPDFQAPTLRRAAAVIYTVGLLAYLLQPPGAPTVELVAPEAAPDWQREIAFTIGHFVGFGVLFALWHRALRPNLAQRAEPSAAAITMTVGVLAELLQNLQPGRAASLYDVVIDALGMALVWWIIRCRATQNNPTTDSSG